MLSDECSMTTRDKEEWTLDDVVQATGGRLLVAGRGRHRVHRWCDFLFAGQGESPAARSRYLALFRSGRFSLSFYYRSGFRQVETSDPGTEPAVSGSV